MKNSLALTVIGMILITALAMTACTGEETLPAEKTNQVVVNYVIPTKPAHQQIYKLLKERHSLEKLQELLSPFRLRWPLNISLTECDGEADASYGDDTITICYEYIEELRNYMPAETTPARSPWELVDDRGPIVTEPRATATAAAANAIADQSPSTT